MNHHMQVEDTDTDILRLNSSRMKDSNTETDTLLMGLHTMATTVEGTRPRRGSEMLPVDCSIASAAGAVADMVMVTAMVMVTHHGKLKNNEACMMGKVSSIGAN
jgi:hypothetical protein